jgi:protein gp37
LADKTKIEWADATVNFWIGCDPVSIGCDFCYAEELAARYGWAKWGPNEVRHRTGPSSWNAPEKWNRAPEKLIGQARHDAGEKPFIFVNSLSDFGDNRVPLPWFVEALDKMAAAPNLIFLVLTKRPKVLAKRLRDSGRSLPPNVALGTSIVEEKEVDQNVPAILDIPGAAFYFVSAEPLLGDIARKLALYLGEPGHADTIGWVIAGGESGRKARPMLYSWAKHLEIVCRETGAVFLFKQWGEWAPENPRSIHDIAKGRGFRMVEGHWMRRLGKGRAGRLLNGCEYNGRPTHPAVRRAA